MKYCTKCGCQLNDDDLFCPKCGTKQMVIEQQPIQQEVDQETIPIEEVDMLSKSTPEKPVFSLVCAQCGSNDIEMLSETEGRCNHCGTMLRIQDNKTYINNVNINMRQTGDVPLAYYKVMPDKSAKQFEKAAYTALAENEKTPIDIFEKSEFQPVKNSTRKILMYKAFVKVSYTARVGMDIEEIVGKHWDDNKKQWIYDKKKTIEWQPVSGTHEDEYEVCLPAEAKTQEDVANNGYYKYLHCAIDYDAKQVSFDGKGIVLTSENKDLAKNDLETEAYHAAKHSIAGDHVEDFRPAYKTEITEIIGYVVPEYSMEFTYSDEEGTEDYIVSSFAAGNLTCWGSIPNHFQTYENKATTKNLWFVIPTLLLLLVSIIVSFTVKNITLIWILFAISFVLFVISIITKHALKKHVVNDSLQQKQEKLAKFLVQKGLK